VILTFCERKIYHWRCEIPGYHKDELCGVEMSREQKLCSWSRTREQSFVSVYRVSSVSLMLLLFTIDMYALFVGAGF
jgi:hypothetical protein